MQVLFLQIVCLSSTEDLIHNHLKSILAFSYFTI